MGGFLLAVIPILVLIVTVSSKKHDHVDNSKRLYEYLTKDYNRLVRPVMNNTNKLVVRLGLKLSQLLDVDEKNQIMTTNVWLEHEWNDFGLRWNPEDYGGIQMMYLPSEKLWLPDIVLFNNADGNYEVTLMTKATVKHDGTVYWSPPAIYKSSCTINVEYFPFDEQECSLKFGSWTYNGDQVDLRHLQHTQSETYEGNEVDIMDLEYFEIQRFEEEKEEKRVEEAIDLKEFYSSVEWDLMSVPAEKSDKQYPCCVECYPEITYSINIRRKALFYTVNMIIPCVSLSFLTVLVFYLPSECGEKITLCISILLSLTVFFLLLAEIIPPTSVVVPLLGKYLLFTMVLITLSVVVTVIVLNIHYRTPATHDLPQWARKIFIDYLPKFIFMERPYFEPSFPNKKNCRCGAPLADASGDDRTPNALRKRLRNGYQPRPSVEITFDNVYGRDTARQHYLAIPQTVMEESEDAEDSEVEEVFYQVPSSIRYSPAMQQAIDGVRYIAKNLRETDADIKICEDWKFIAMVLDRLFLWIFTLMCAVGTFAIILKAPSIYDRRIPLRAWNASDLK